MIVEISSGDGGIKEYLENGQKSDRYFSRDELDERIPLDGDLAFVDNVINSIDRGKDKYFHITLSFKENEISTDIMSKIVDDYKNFFMKSFGEDELACYAEAHNPRIKSYVDKDGKVVERKPHIHLIIPKVNLKTGKKFDTFIDNYIPYNDAWQESINAKFGLESPKDNPRYKINDNSDFINRYTGDGFKGKNKDFKVKLLNDIITKNISSFAELKDHLSTNNNIVIRNNRDSLKNQYINIQSPNGNINLRDHVFKEEFLKLSQSEKLQLIQDNQSNISQKILLPGAERSLDEKYKILVDEWNNYKAYETRYTANLSKNQREKFNDLTQRNKDIIINNFKEKINNVNITNDIGVINGTEFSQHEYQRVIDSTFESTRLSATDLENAITRRSGIERVDDARREGWRNVVKSRLERSTRESWRGERGHSGDNYNSVNISLNPESSVVGNTKYQNNKNTDNKSQQFKKHIKDLNDTVKINVLLELLEKTHGVNPELYRITVAKDGTDRVGVGLRNHNSLDFLLKHMNLPVGKSVELLESSINMQNNIHRNQCFVGTTGNYLHYEYIKWLDEYKKERATLLLENKEQVTNLKTQLSNKYKKLTSDIYSNKSFIGNKSFAIRALKFEQSAELKNLNKLLYKINQETRNKYNLEMQNSYREFLLRRSQENDEQALRELRRLRIDYQTLTTTLTFNYVERYQEFRLPLTHHIDKNGIISYKLNNITVVKDHGAKVEVTKVQEQTLEFSFKIARQKFGDKINLTGNDDFKRKAVDFAIKNNYKITFTDEFSKNYHENRVSTLQEQETLINDDSKQLAIIIPSKLQIVAKSIKNTIRNDKYKTVKTITLKDIDTDKQYEISPRELELKDEFEIGDFISTYQNKQTNEIQIKLANEQRIKRELEKQVVAEKSTLFTQEVLKKYGVDKPLQAYTGKITRIKVDKYGKTVILLKSVDGFININNPTVCVKLKDAKVGSIVSVIIPDEIDVVTQKTIKQTTVEKISTVNELVQPYKNTEKSIIGEILKQQPMILANGKTVVRITFKNLETNKVEAIFNTAVLNVRNSEIVRLDYNSWNNYTHKSIPELKSTLEEIKSSQDSTYGSITGFGEVLIRGKPVWFVELKTTEGTVKKYGDKLKQQLESASIGIGDSISIKSKTAQIQKVEKQPIFEVKDLSRDLLNEVAILMNK